MSWADMRYCLQPNCSEMVQEGYCPAHTRQNERARGSQRERGYNRRWEARAGRFKAHYPLCGMRPNGQRPVMSQCFEEGRATPVYQVDHVVPHRHDPVLFWDELGNWQSLCARCGNRKTRLGF